MRVSLLGLAASFDFHLGGGFVTHFFGSSKGWEMVGRSVTLQVGVLCVLLYMMVCARAFCVHHDVLLCIYGLGFASAVSGGVEFPG